MELTLSSDLQTKLARAAGRRGLSAEVFVQEAIERTLDHDDWFIREVEAGLVQIETGRVLTHEALGMRLERKLTGHWSRR